MASGDWYSLIRIFPDYADSVIWFIMGTVSYEESQVSDALRREMEAWEAHYYEAIGDDFVWRSSDDRKHHAAEGRRLAERLSAEVGRGFQVEYFDERHQKVRVRSDRPATNSPAADAFARVAAAQRDLDARIEREKAAGATFGWYADVPRTTPPR